APLGVPLLSLTTMPSRSESSITKVNALRAANELAAVELAGRILVDNERLLTSFPGLDLLHYYPAVNEAVLGVLDEINRWNRRDDLWSIRTFDSEDLRKVLLSGGIVQMHTTRIQLSEAALDQGLEARQLIDVVQAGIDGGAYLVQGTSLAQVAYLALVVTGPAALLRATPMGVFDAAAGLLKEETGGAAVYEGVYVAPDEAPLTVHVLTASFRLPGGVGALLDAARAEGQELARKARREIEPLALTGLEDLAMPPSAPRHRAALRPPPSAPRSLQEQLAAQLQPASTTWDETMRPVVHDDFTPRGPVPSVAPWRIPEADFGGQAVRRAGSLRPPAPPPLGRIEARGTAVTSSAPLATLPTSGPPPAVLEANTAPLVQPLAALALRAPPANALVAAVASQDSIKTDDVDAPWTKGASAALRSVRGDTETELQSTYEELVERYRGTQESRERERVVRRLVDDAQTDDVEIRALAIWAMVSLGDPAFERTLSRCRSDENAEIAHMATAGCARLLGG
ncbi:MAG: hypothetical protein ACO3JL_17345, partial [Myxococcota bacterium]